MQQILEVLRLPVVVCLLSAVIGVGVGLAYELGSRRAWWGAVGVVGVSCTLIAALAPDVTLAASALVLGLAVTAVVREAVARRRWQCAGGC